MKDWGIEQYIRNIPKRVKEAVQASAGGSLYDRVINQESRGRHTTSDGKLLTSHKGARGISQVMPKTGEDPGYGVAPLKNETEAEYRRFGKDYLNAMLREYNGDERMALAAYNAGPGNVNKAIEKAKTKGGDFTLYLPKRQETIPYLDNILGTKEGMYG